jgi:2-succinyl-5-enolpyruvyl-6-hydroxy-3-cyclohexene-1-carboxylate synthase
VVVEPEAPPRPASGPGPHPAGRLVIVAGAGTPDPDGITDYAARVGIPVLADPLSGARRGPAAVAHYDLLLRFAGFTAERHPDFIFRLGDLPTSKPLRAWLAGLADVPQVAFDPHQTWQDPDAVVGMRLRSSPPRPEQIRTEAGWLESWTDPDAAVAQTIDELLGAELSEPGVARRLSQWLDAETTLFVASSMPIRDVEEFAAARADGPRYLANRGANGIDGTVSSAFGVAATGQPTVLLIGDVALAHDIGGLIAARRAGLPLTIVLLNNDGGGIFHFLPVAGEADAFEEHVATPHGLEFARVAELYGLDYAQPRDESELKHALARSQAGAGTTLIEIRTNRQENLALHRRIAEAADTYR